MTSIYSYYCSTVNHILILSWCIFFILHAHHCMTLAFPHTIQFMTCLVYLLFCFVLTVLHKVFWQILIINLLVASFITSSLQGIIFIGSINFWYYRLFHHTSMEQFQALIFTQMRPLSEFQRHRMHPVLILILVSSPHCSWVIAYHLFCTSILHSVHIVLCTSFFQHTSWLGPMDSYQGMCIPFCFFLWASMHTQSSDISHIFWLLHHCSAFVISRS